MHGKVFSRAAAAAAALILMVTEAEERDDVWLAVRRQSGDGQSATMTSLEETRNRELWEKRGAT